MAFKMSHDAKVQQFVVGLTLMSSLSSGSTGCGWMLWLMTGYPPKMESCCLFTQLRAQSFGALWWRRLTPSMKSSSLYIFTKPSCRVNVQCLKFLRVRQGEWILWGLIRRKYHRRVRGFHRRDRWNIHLKQSSSAALPNHSKGPESGFTDGLLYRRKSHQLIYLNIKHNTVKSVLIKCLFCFF